MLRSLSNRNFRLYFGGLCLSMIGTMMQVTSLSWVVWKLAEQFDLSGWPKFVTPPLILSFVTFAGQLPLFICTPLSGVILDRHSRLRILLITQCGLLVVAATIAALAFGNSLTLWNIIALQLMGGLLLSMDMPGRQAFIVDIVGSGPELPNAVALNSFVINSSKIIGPAAGGFLLTRLSPAWCFTFNTASYCVVLAVLLMMRVPPARQSAGGSHLLRELLEGWRYAWGSMPIRNLLGLVGLFGLFGMCYIVLLPIFADKVLHGGAHTFGWLMASSGVGSVFAGVFLATRKSVIGAEIYITVGAIVCSVGLLIFSQSSGFWLSCAALFLVGLGAVMLFALCNTMLQTLVDPDKRGRVMSLFTLGVMGTSPIGALLAGLLASRLGAPAAVSVLGLVCMATGILFALRLAVLQEGIHPIYRQKGILPEIATGLGEASRVSTPEG